MDGDHLLFSLLTCDANEVVKPTWMTAPVEEALKLQRPLGDKLLNVVATGKKRMRPKGRGPRAGDFASNQA